MDDFELDCQVLARDAGPWQGEPAPRRPSRAAAADEGAEHNETTTRRAVNLLFPN